MPSSWLTWGHIVRPAGTSDGSGHGPNVAPTRGLASLLSVSSGDGDRTSGSARHQSISFRHLGPLTAPGDVQSLSERAHDTKNYSEFNPK